MVNLIPQMNLGYEEDFSGPVFDPLTGKFIEVDCWNPQKEQDVHHNLPSHVSQQNTLSCKVVPLNGSTTQSDISDRVDGIIYKKFKDIHCQGCFMRFLFAFRKLYIKVVSL